MDKSRADHSLLLYFGVTFGFSWIIWLVGILASFGLLSLPLPKMVFSVIGAFGPFVAAFGLSHRRGGWSAVKKLLFSGFNFRIKPIWWIIIILLPVILSGIAVWINVSITGFQFDKTLLEQPLMIVPTFLAMFFIGGSFQEEFGWRGYALPRLLRKWNPAAASIILGSVWGFWHLPLFFITDTGQSFMNFGIFFLMVLSFTVLFTWFSFKTNQNLFSALLFHTAINTSMSIFPPIEKVVGGNQKALTYLMIAYAAVAIIVLVKDRTLFFSKDVNRSYLPIKEGSVGV